jgi:hypothetical protein
MVSSVVASRIRVRHNLTFDDVIVRIESQLHNLEGHDIHDQVFVPR